MVTGRGRSTRQHFGQGKLAIDPAKAVFINCPFDPDFEPTFDAIVFAVVCGGFMPRSALETGDIAVPRMERIVRAIFSSQLSIHDLSRCRGEGDERLARFNMPLELGIAMARRFQPEPPGGQHDWLLLVPEGHHYARFISDLAGYDPVQYDGNPATVIPKVMIWLATRPSAVQILLPRDVVAAFPEFQARKASLKAAWGDSPPWADLVLAAIEIFETKL
ncbi:MAG TPA: hypothetical protein DD490_21920 [Acidobacteria bacterium]|nr:hypothetical protein [Acidobacteriota bacterium]